jgi:hypothetical protein
MGLDLGRLTMAGRASSRVPDWVEPMLAKADGGRLCTGPEWAYEYKLDGYRACPPWPGTAGCPRPGHRLMAAEAPTTCGS